MAAPRRILFVRTDRLGEVLLNLPALMALRAAYPAARMTFMAAPDLCQLLSGLSGVDEWLEYQDRAGRPWWSSAARLAGQWRVRRFDLAVISNPKKEFHAASWLAGIKIRAGYDRKWGCLLTHRLPDRKSLGQRHEVEYNLELIRAAGADGPVPVWRMPAYEVEQAQVAQLLQGQGIQPSDPLVAVHPWSSNPRKEWPMDRFHALMARLGSSARVVVLGGPQERQRISAAWPQPAADLVGRLSLRQLAAVLKRVRLLISNDSGPVHLAAAMRTPTVALFVAPDAATGPARWGPWGPGHRVIWKPAAEEITVEEVLAAATAPLA